MSKGSSQRWFLVLFVVGCVALFLGSWQLETLRQNVEELKHYYEISQRVEMTPYQSMGGGRAAEEPAPNLAGDVLIEGSELIEDRGPQLAVPLHAVRDPKQRRSTGGIDRQLSSLQSVGTAVNDGCFIIPDEASKTYELSVADCNFHKCPDCFITHTSCTQHLVLEVGSCSTALIGTRGATRSGIWSYTFINRCASNTLTVNNNILSAESVGLAYCDSASGLNQLYWVGETVTATTTTTTTTDCFFPDTDLFGNDIAAAGTAGTMLACQADCAALSGCNFFSWLSDGSNSCWYKFSDAGRTPNTAVQSGTATCR